METVLNLAEMLEITSCPDRRPAIIRGMKKDAVQLLQFFVCRDFRTDRQDAYQAEKVLSNLYVPSFPAILDRLYVVTCWRKDSRFHKEVIEYATDDGLTARSPHMDIEPLKGTVLYRWHKHRFPGNFRIPGPTHLSIRVLLDGAVQFESYILIEKK